MVQYDKALDILADMVTERDEQITTLKQQLREAEEDLEVERGSAARDMDRRQADERLLGECRDKLKRYDEIMVKRIDARLGEGEDQPQQDHTDLLRRCIFPLQNLVRLMRRQGEYQYAEDVNNHLRRIYKALKMKQLS